MVRPTPIRNVVIKAESLLPPFIQDLQPVQYLDVAQRRAAAPLVVNAERIVNRDRLPLSGTSFLDIRNKVFQRLACLGHAHQRYKALRAAVGMQCAPRKVHCSYAPPVALVDPRRMLDAAKRLPSDEDRLTWSTL